MHAQLSDPWFAAGLVCFVLGLILSTITIAYFLVKYWQQRRPVFLVQACGQLLFCISIMLDIFFIYNPNHEDEQQNLNIANAIFRPLGSLWSTAHTLQMILSLTAQPRYVVVAAYITLVILLSGLPVLQHNNQVLITFGLSSIRMKTFTIAYGFGIPTFPGGGTTLNTLSY
jgi:hypothetical protein